MKFKEIIKEKVSSTVYHFTSLKNAREILEQERFKLTPISGTGSEEKTQSKFNKMFFLSLARNKTSEYIIKESFLEGVTFVLNGDWFNQKHKSKSVDYFERAWLKRRQVTSGSDDAREMEDRVISDEPYIDFSGQTHKLIKEIHILLSDNFMKMRSEELRTKLKPFLINAKKNNIPVYMYNDKSAFITHNKNQSRSIKDFIENIKNVPFDNKQNVNKIRQKMDKKSNDYFKNWLELYHKNGLDNLSKDARRMALDLARKRKLELIEELTTEIHNNRRSNLSALNNLVKAIKHVDSTQNSTDYSSKTEKFVDYLSQKWSGIVD